MSQSSGRQMLLTASAAASLAIPLFLAAPVAAAGPPAPTVPTHVKATTAQNGSSQVSWVPSAPTGGVPISSYTVTSTPGSLTCATKPTVRTCIVFGLTNGTSYTFTVSAVNALGESATSAATKPVVPSTTPTAPAAVRASTGQSGKSLVKWAPPTDTGGVPVSRYIVQGSSDGGKTWTNKASVASTRTFLVIHGLANGSTYLFRVAAQNASGTGPSTVSNPVIPTSTPAVPSAPSASGVANGAELKWSAPSTTGGTPITGYVVHALDLTKRVSTTYSFGTAQAEAVTGLIDGHFYAFTVAALNSAGTGLFSPASNVVIPQAGPGAPTNVAVTGSLYNGNNWYARVTWLTSVSHGAHISGYTVTATDATDPTGDRTCVTGASSGAGNLRECTVSFQVPGDAYSYAVTATNANGTATASTPGSVMGVSLSLVSSGNVQVSWSAPTSGETPVSYVASANDNDAASCTASFGTNTCTLSAADLTSLSGFTVTVRAVDAVGNSGLTGWATTAPAATSAPVAVGGQDGAVPVSWSPVGKVPITNYVVTATDVTSPGTDGDGNTCVYTVGPDTGNTCTVTGLTGGDSYTFSVTVNNDYGSSSPSEASNEVTPTSAVPGAPTGVAAVDNGDGTTTVSWTASNPEGSPVTGYTVTATDLTNPGINGDGTTCTSTDPTDSCTIAGLTEGDLYTFSVVATNGDGTSPPGLSSPTN